NDDVFIAARRGCVYWLTYRQNGARDDFLHALDTYTGAHVSARIHASACRDLCVGPGGLYWIDYLDEEETGPANVVHLPMSAAAPTDVNAARVVVLSAADEAGGLEVEAERVSWFEGNEVAMLDRGSLEPRRSADPGGWPILGEDAVFAFSAEARERTRA